MGRIIGIDYGTKRVGLAISDGLGLTARPLEVVARDQVVARVSELSNMHEIDKLIVGLPRALAGHEGESAGAARALGAELEAATGLEVEFVDERFTSRIAEQALLGSGMRRRERREKVDKVAAAIILQGYLEREASKGNSSDA